VHDLDQLDSEFDVVLALEVLEHLLDPIGAFSSATKLLRPGGIAIVSVPNAFNWRNRLRMLFGRLPASGVGPPGVRGHTYDAPHIRFFDLASFRHALERVGLKRIQSMTDSPDLSRMSRFLPDRMWRLSETRALFATTLVAVGKKEPCR
jgi:SAM-dependent methyltransferase